MRGSFLGLAFGDVFGCPMEGWEKELVNIVFPRYDALPLEYPFDRIRLEAPELLQQDNIHRLRPVGMYSDDTQQAMSLINVCLDDRGWTAESPQHWADWMVRGMDDLDQPVWRGFGGQGFGRACDQLSGDNPKPPQRAGNRGHPGIGAAMRIAPLGALFDDRDTFIDAVMQSSCMTHANIMAGACAYACAWSVRELIAGSDLDEIKAGLPDEVRAVESDWPAANPDWRINVKPENTFSDRLRDVLSCIPNGGECCVEETLSAVKRRIVELAEDDKRRYPDLPPHPSAGRAVLGGLHGIALPFIANASAIELLRAIVMEGKDTDTVAAIAGGILGARDGTDWIDTEKLHDRDRLEAYADALVERNGPPESLAGFIERERQLCAVEGRYKAKIASLWAT